MGWGKHIVLACECGFSTERAMVGHLLAHECDHEGFTVIDATYDATNRQIVTHSFTLPRNIELLLDSGATAEYEAKAERWFELQREAVRERHGHLLNVLDDEVTDFECPACGIRKLALRVDGDWIA